MIEHIIHGCEDGKERNGNPCLICHVNKIGDALNRLEKQEEWPKRDALYFYIEGNGVIYADKWYNNRWDNSRRDTFGIFKDEASAKERLELIKRYIQTL